MTEMDIVARLRALVALDRPENGGPYGGYAASMCMEAMREAATALETAAKAQPRDYTDFDTWFHEQEGTSLRSERFNGDVEWLKAAFDAGRSAQPSISTGQGEPVAWLKHHADGVRRRVDLRRGFDPWMEHEGGWYEIPLYTHPSLPAGHVAVPVEPTEEMVEAFMAEMGAQRVALDDFSEPIYPAKLYRAMLSALPHNQGEGK